MAGKLLWDGVKAKTKEEKYNTIYEIKSNLFSNNCSILYKIFKENNINSNFVMIFKYIKELKFSEKPNYDYLKQVLKDISSNYCIKYDYEYDWTYNCNTDEFKGFTIIDNKKPNSKSNYNSEDYIRRSESLNISLNSSNEDNIREAVNDNQNFKSQNVDKFIDNNKNCNENNNTNEYSCKFNKNSFINTSNDKLKSIIKKPIASDNKLISINELKFVINENNICNKDIDSINIKNNIACDYNNSKKIVFGKNKYLNNISNEFNL